jgi:hypothetical protein
VEKPADDNYENESFIKEEVVETAVLAQSKNHSVVEVESRTSIKGSTLRISGSGNGVIKQQMLEP